MMVWDARASSRNRLPIPDERILLKADLHFPLSFLLLSLLLSFRGAYPVKRFSACLLPPIPQQSLLFLATHDSHDYRRFALLTLDFWQVEATTRRQRTKNEDEFDDGTQWSEINLTLQPFHYTNGQLTLRCTAQIPNIYSTMNEIQLGAGMREPVPERGKCIRILIIFTLFAILLWWILVVHTDFKLNRASHVIETIASYAGIVDATWLLKRQHDSPSLIIFGSVWFIICARARSCVMRSCVRLTQMRSNLG